MQPFRSVVIGFCLIASFIGGALATDAPSATLNIEHVVHFQSADGSDLALTNGSYSVEAAMPQGMRLRAASGKPVIVPATVATHDQKLGQPQALIVPVGADEQHLILLLPDGMRLEAIGSLSGIRSRGLAPGPSTISNAALQTAVMQLQPAPVMAAAPAPAPAPVVQAPVAAVQAPLAVAPPVVMLPQPSLIPTAGPPPSGVTLAATPLVAYLSWNAMPDVVRYAVWRGDGPNVSVERTPPGFAGTQFQDVVPDPRLVYRYSIVAYYPNGTSAEAPVVQFISPPMINPAGFTARDGGDGHAVLEWQTVPGAEFYRLDGPGLPNTGQLLTRPNSGFAGATIPNVAAGPRSWRLVALYPGNYGDYPGASMASTILRVLPPHSLPWLTKPNGPGLPFQVQTPAHQEINDTTGTSAVGNRSGDLLPIYSSTYAAWLGQDYQWSSIHLSAACYSTCGAAFRLDDGIGQPGSGEYIAGPACKAADNLFTSLCHLPGLKLWLNINSPLWDEAEAAIREAVYGNPVDLGVGRRAYCEQKMRGAPEPGNFTVVPGLYTVCYATAHGFQPGQPGFNDPGIITHPGEGVGDDFILSMVITKDASGTVFLALGKNGKYPLLPTVQLDTEGPKLLPFVCTSCHGGRYNPSTRKVDGASFLPLNPGLLAFASPADQAAQEEKIRNINLMIYNSEPRSAIGAYILGLYNGALGQPGARAQPDYVPAGWAPQAGFYRQVVRPYCTMCHLAQPGGKGSYNFASWGNFQGNAGAIYGSVCAQHTMPHSELQFKEFWTRDTGPMYLPGLLAWTLGFPSCP
jgi:hypothetical protein